MPGMRVCSVLTFLLFAALLFVPVSVLAVAPFTPGMAESSTLQRQNVPEKEVSMPELLNNNRSRQPVFPSDGRRIHIERFAISGNTVFSEDELRAVIRDKEGSDLTLAEIYAQANRLTAFYRQHGYTLATVTVPAQYMRGGVLQLLVVEGRVGRLVFSGNERYDNSFLACRLKHVAPGSVVRFDDLERELLLLNDLPGLEARSVLVPGAASGTTDINFNFREKSVEAALSVDNSGRKFVGRWRFGADLLLNNPLRIGDVFSVSYTHSQNDMFRQIKTGYGVPVFSSGDRFDVGYSRSEYYVGKEFDDLDIEGSSETTFVKYTHILRRSISDSMYGALAFYHLRGKAEMLDRDITNDNVNYLDIGINYVGRNQTGARGSAAAHLALNFQGDSDADRGYTRFQFNGDYEQFISKRLSAYARVEVVLSSDALPDLNKYSIGGFNSVRGFVSSARRGDQGWIGSVELRYRYSTPPADLMLSCFVDSGKVDSKGTVITGGSDSITSVGVGLHAVIAQHYIVDVQWASPVDGNNAGDDLNAPIWVIFSAVY